MVKPMPALGAKGVFNSIHAHGISSLLLRSLSWLSDLSPWILSFTGDKNRQNETTQNGGFWMNYPVNANNSGMPFLLGWSDINYYNVSCLPKTREIHGGGIC